VVSSYDFEAADWLSRQLANLEDKAKWLAWYRGQQHKAFLGSEKSDNWTGPRRHKFEGEFDTGQQTLGQLAAAAAQAKNAVDAATANAHQVAQAKRHHKA
jgi:hypothetical protein